MSDLKEDGRLESDNLVDFALMNNRLHSFNGSSLVEQVPAERLARAGFYYTGHADRVRCFSCEMTVENWCSGDTPVERHKEVSPDEMEVGYTQHTHTPSYPLPTYLI